jgi:hypothetical protein
MAIPSTLLIADFALHCVKLGGGFGIDQAREDLAILASPVK